MDRKYKLVDTGEKSKVLTFRLGETIYSELEKLAEETGSTVSQVARRLVLAGLRDRDMVYRAGDTLKLSSTDTAVIIAGAYLTEQDIESRLKRLFEKPGGG